MSAAIRKSPALLDASGTAGRLVIRTLGRRGHRRSVFPKYIVVVPHGDPPPDKAVLFLSGHEMISDLSLVNPDGGWTGRDYARCRLGLVPAWALRIVDIYRGQARALEQHGGCIRSDQIVRSPVSDQERDFISRHLSFLNLKDAEALDELVRFQRGDLTSIRFLVDSPWNLSYDEAVRASTASMGVEHLVAGIKQESGRWVYFRGQGPGRVVEGSADTREEAEVLARAVLMKSWLERLEQILRLRGGSLEWGLPVTCPDWNHLIVEE